MEIYLYNKIQEFCEVGDGFAESGDYTKAQEEYSKAYDLIPEPKTNWEATTWVLVAKGDANFLSGDYEEGRVNLNYAMNCPDAIGNPFIHLRLGQCQFELGDMDEAADELTRAYTIEGEEIFEEEDSKYLDFLTTRIITE